MTVLAYLLVAFNSLLSIYLFVQKRRLSSPFQFFYLMLFSLSIFPSFLDIQTGPFTFHPFAPPIYLSPRLVATAHSKIAVMLMLFVLFERFLGRHSGPPIELPKLQIGFNIYDCVIGLLIVALMGGVWAYGLADLSKLSFDDIRYGKTSQYALLIFYIQAMIVGVPAIYWLKGNRKLTAAGVLLLFATTYLFMGGSRQTIILSLAVFFALVLAKQGAWRYVLLIVIFTIGFSTAEILLQAVKALRNLPSTGQRMALLADLLAGNADLEGTSLEGTVRYVMYGFLNDRPPPDFGQLAYFRRALLFWLPSAIAFEGLKPPDFEMTMFAEAMGNRSGTMHATFFGSAYADAKAFSFIWVAWFVLGFRLLEGIMLRLRPLERSMVWSSCIYLSFMAARGSLYAPLVITATVLLLAWLSRVLQPVFGTEALVAGDGPLHRPFTNPSRQIGQ
ncbi:MAG: hypothetical protein ABIP91_09090 [Sphingomicrobium sp.]